jgi:hypothetical protein
MSIRGLVRARHARDYDYPRADPAWCASGNRGHDVCAQRKWEPADKPGSVVGNHSSGPAVTGGLKQPTRKRRGPRHCFPIWSCSRWGLPSHSVLPRVRCALTAPFHPYRSRPFSPDRRYIFCCTFRRLAPPRRYLAPCPVEPGLSSPSCDGAIAWPTPGLIVSY